MLGFSCSSRSRGWRSAIGSLLAGAFLLTSPAPGVPAESQATKARVFSVAKKAAAKKKGHRHCVTVRRHGHRHRHIRVVIVKRYRLVHHPRRHLGPVFLGAWSMMR